MDFLFPKEFLARYGEAGEAWPLDEAQAYTRWLSGAHYENFHVVSFLLPKHLHQDFFNVYAYCRWADDLGDELGDPQRSLDALRWWRSGLEGVYAGQAPSHPVFVALAGTIERRRLPQEPFEHLIRAFELDQTKTRYQTYGEVLDYCVYSANPVGRLVLALCGYRDAERLALSDSICTGLQLANHWQDVRRDFYDRDRIYLPAELIGRHGYSYEALEADLGRQQGSTPARELVRDLVDRAQTLFDAGAGLPSTLDRRLAIDIELFRRGGMAILDKIRRGQYDVIARRPKIGKLQRVGLVVQVLGSRLFARSGDAPSIAQPGAGE